MRLDALTISVKADCFDDTALPHVNPGVKADDRGFVARAVAGDRDAFRQLIDMHQEKVSRLAMRLLGYRSDVDDVVQDVFVLALENVKRFRGECAFATWLTKLTISRCRRERLRRVLKLKFLRGGAHPRRETIEQSEVERDEGHERVRCAVAGLPPKLREVIVLRYLEEMESDDAAHVLSISRSAFDVRLHRAREQLRVLLTESETQ